MTEKILLKQILLIFTYTFLLLVLFFNIPEQEGTIDKNYLLVYISIFFISLFIHFAFSDNKNWFRLDVIFLLGFLIVHFQWPAMIALSDIEPNLFSRSASNSNFINYGTWLSAVGGICWILGYSLKSKRRTTIPERHIGIIKTKALFWFTFILFIAFILTAGTAYLSGAVYKGQSESNLGGGMSTYIYIILNICVVLLCAAEILNVSTKYKDNKLSYYNFIKKIDKKFLVFIFFYVTLFFSAGDRGVGIRILFTFLVLIGTLYKPISFKVFIICTVVGALLISLIGLGRSVDSNEGIITAGVNKVNFESGYDVTIELGNSAQTLYVSLANVPFYYDYFYGKLWLGHVLSVGPFFQNIYISLSDDKKYELTSADFVTYLLFGEDSINGAGTSLVAEFYLNFGQFGVIAGFLFLGMFFRKVEDKLIERKVLFWVVLAALLASYAFYMGRGGLTLRPFIWGIGFAWLFLVQRRWKIKT